MIKKIKTKRDFLKALNQPEFRFLEERELAWMTTLGRRANNSVSRTRC